MFWGLSLHTLKLLSTKFGFIFMIKNWLSNHLQRLDRFVNCNEFSKHFGRMQLARLPAPDLRNLHFVVLDFSHRRALLSLLLPRQMVLWRQSVHQPTWEAYQQCMREHLRTSERTMFASNRAINEIHPKALAPAASACTWMILCKISLKCGLCAFVTSFFSIDAVFNRISV